MPTKCLIYFIVNHPTKFPMCKRKNLHCAVLFHRTVISLKSWSYLTLQLSILAWYGRRNTFRFKMPEVLVSDTRFPPNQPQFAHAIDTACLYRKIACFSSCLAFGVRQCALWTPDSSNRFCLKDFDIYWVVRKNLWFSNSIDVIFRD